MEHYNSGIQVGPALHNRLMRIGAPQRVNLSAADKAALAAFMKTLDAPVLNGDARFTDPFRP